MARTSRTSPLLQLIWLPRLLVGALFVFSGFVKINDVGGFAIKLDKYWYAFESYIGLNFSALSAISFELSFVVAVFETIVGLLLLLGLFRQFTTWVLTAMIILFTILTGWAAITRSISDCGCFGNAISLEPWQSFSKDVILLGLIIILFIFREQIQPIFSQRVLYYTMAGLAVAVPLGIALYTSTFLPLIDFRACKVGKNMEQLVNQPDPKTGMLPLPGYYPLESACDTTHRSEFEGNTLLIFAKNFKKADSEALKQMQRLAEQAQAKGIRVFGLVGGMSEKELQQYNQQYNLSFCTSLQDQDMIKTCMRSNPGYLYMQNGTILGKWSKNNRPTAAELMQLSQ